MSFHYHICNKFEKFDQMLSTYFIVLIQSDFPICVSVILLRHFILQMIIAWTANLNLGKSIPENIQRTSFKSVCVFLKNIRSNKYVIPAIYVALYKF